MEGLKALSETIISIRNASSYRYRTPFKVETISYLVCDAPFYFKHECDEDLRSGSHQRNGYRQLAGFSLSQWSISLALNSSPRAPRPLTILG